MWVIVNTGGYAYEVARAQGTLLKREFLPETTNKGYFELYFLAYDEINHEILINQFYFIQKIKTKSKRQ